MEGIKFFGWSLDKKLNILKNARRRELQIIGIWIEQKGLKPQNEEQFQSIIKRNIRTAKLLKGYSDEDIIDTIKKLKKTDYLTKYTLETVLKFIDEVVAEKVAKANKTKIVGWVEIKDADGTIKMKPVFKNPVVGQDKQN